jgi:RNA polymerase-binding transcription factor DksA
MPDPTLDKALLQRAAQWLAQREAQLQGEIAASGPVERARSEPRTGFVHDAKDDAEQAQRAELGDAEVARDADELAAVRAAQRRLARGDYGVCEDCGEPIGAARLQAQPAALRCAACQQRFESRARTTSR